ncbi:efflux RND transporter permease subunit [Cyclobacterium marinum]|uniref:efflux RND transporter permease subunit n=1 Tax=Cyclobacterium marinum TaxID=104 RepID=UPI0030DC7940|tara:strand:- start:139329 stop:142439 length:3111 start_codon:yes stop_codon:yes gene_type:complete
MKEQSNQVSERGPIAFMARNPIITNLLMVIFLVGGIYTMYTIQKEVFPQFQLDIVEVSVVYPGAAPEEVEQGIVLPVEEKVREVQGIMELISSANEGSGTVEIWLIPGTDRMKALQDINQAVSRIQTFPDDIERPQIVLQNQQMDVMQVGIYGNVNVWTLRILAERLRTRLLGDEQITQVEIGNVPDFVTHVEIPRNTLLQYNLTLGEIADLIEASSRDIPAGSIETLSGEILLRMEERKLIAEEFANIDIISSASGATIKLGDIASIRDGFEEVGFNGQFEQQNTVDLEVFRIGDQSPLEIEEKVKSILTEFGPSLPPGVKVRIESNRAEDFRERLSLLTENGLMAIVIVLVILGLFLEYRLAFWVMMGMTVSFVGAMLFLPIVGLSINMISMFGFLIVLGIVVDDAIVVGENIYEFRQKGYSYIDAAILGAKDVSKPVIISILTTVIAFVPLLFIPGETGKYWWPLPVVVIVVLFVSLFEALFILPSHVTKSPREKKHAWVKKLEVWQNSIATGFNRVINKYYKPFLDLCLRNRYLTFSAAISLLVLVGGFAYSDHMGTVLMPEVAADEIEAAVRLPVGTTNDQAAKVATEITNNTHKMFEDYDLYEVAYGVKTNVRGKDFIDVEIVMKPPDQRDMGPKELIAIWRDNIGDIKGVDQINFEAERGPGGARQDISVDLSHPDIDVLERASQAFLERVESFTETRDVSDNYNKGKRQLGFELLPEGRNLGLTPNMVGQQVRDAFFGALAMRQLRGINEFEVRVKLPLEERKDIHYLEDFIIQAPNGVSVPLLDVVRVKEGETFTNINRRDGKRVVNVGMDVEPPAAQTRVLKALNQQVLPQLRADFPGIAWTYEGSQAQMRESTEALWSGFIIAMLLIFCLLAIALNSYSQPIIIMLAIPFGIVGAVIGHILLGYDLSLVSLMGVIALSGVVVNDSLIMIDYANKNRKAFSAYEAIHEAGVRRFRPIILTTLTTFGGLTPIILETSSQAFQLIPMAISLGFGIIFATAIILVIVPCLYMIFEDLVAAVKFKEKVNT